MRFIKSVTLKRRAYEELVRSNFYQRHIGNWHLTTIYHVAGNKEAPLYKRILSHVYVLYYVKVIDD